MQYSRPCLKNHLSKIWKVFTKHLCLQIKIFKKVKLKQRKTLRHLNPTFQSKNLIKSLQTLQTFQKNLASCTNFVKLFTASKNFIKIVCESYKLCKVVSEFYELHKVAGKFYELLKASFTNIVKCFPTSTNFVKLFAVLTNFLKGWFYQRTLNKKKHYLQYMSLEKCVTIVASCP